MPEKKKSIADQWLEQKTMRPPVGPGPAPLATSAPAASVPDGPTFGPPGSVPMGQPAPGSFDSWENPRLAARGDSTVSPAYDIAAPVAPAPAPAPGGASGGGNASPGRSPGGAKYTAQQVAQFQRGPYQLMGGDYTRVPPPEGFLSDFADDPDATTGWIWNNLFGQYQRVQFDTKSGTWTATEKFRDGPPRDQYGRPLGGLTQVSAGQQTAAFNVGPNKAPQLPGSLGMRPDGGAVPFSTQGIPTLDGVQGARMVGPGETPMIKTANIAEFRGGSFGMGSDVNQVLSAYGIRSSGDPQADQMLVAGVMNKRAELESQGIRDPLVQQVIIENEFKKARAAQMDTLEGMPAL